MVKVVGFVKRRRDLTREQFKEYWLNQHVKLERENVERNPVRRIVASFVLDEPLIGEPPFDGMVELYYHSLEDMKKEFSLGQREVMREDEKNFCDLSKEPVFVVTEEYVMAEKTPRASEI